LGLSAFALLLILPSHELLVAGASDGRNVYRVEEDWRLVLNEPGTEINAPQFHTVMSPTAYADEIYALVSWNYREVPEFSPGGLQLQGWAGDDCLDELSVGENSLSRDAETITWTQRLECSGGPMRFSIVNGRSQSWGMFGGWGITIALDAGVSSLMHYSPMVSKANSCVTFGSNRVNVLMITEVRRYYTDGTMSTDGTPVIVFRAFEDTDSD
jgi:hypothetical protein